LPPRSFASRGDDHAEIGARTEHRELTYLADRSAGTKDARLHQKRLDEGRGKVSTSRVAKAPARRAIRVHRNVPEILRRLSEAFLQRDISTFAQYQETDSEVGYVVLDTDLAGDESHESLEDIRALDGTIRARLVYEN